MSDILIKGMEMPKSCSWCFCMASCKLWKNIMAPEFNRHRNCPLVPVPAHGDLIDRDVLIKKARTQFDWNDVVDVEDIANAPTIIPATK